MDRSLLFARVALVALVTSIGSVSVAFADGSLLKSGARHVEQIAIADAARSGTPASRSPAAAAVSIGNHAASTLQAEQPNLSKSGMRRRTKIMIALAVGVGFAASAWKIDHSVLDVTPSSLGKRED